MSEELLIGLAIGLALSVAFIVWQRRQTALPGKFFEDNAQRALGLMVQEIVKTARDQLAAEKRDLTETIAKDLRTQSDFFKELTQSLRQEIGQRQQEIRRLEEDRNKKYGEISQALVDYKTLTQELRGSTEQLRRILASNQLRGSWGERQAERILEAAGMVPGINYVKQQTLSAESQLRPDFTLLLPNKLHLHVDVKFPLQSLQVAMQSEDKVGQQRALAQFGRDVKERMKEVSKYLSSDSNCVDYVILFVPSESVFEIINKQFPAIIDEGFSQKVIMVSPHSFFAVVRTIQESYTHFHYEENLKEILTYLQTLFDHFGRFKEEFRDVGRAIETAQTKYQQIEGTRYRQIARTTEKIDQYRLTGGKSTATHPPSHGPNKGDG